MPNKTQIPLLDLTIALVLILCIFAIYSQVGRFEFTAFDDNLYVTDNPHVQAGLTPESIKWAMTAVVASNWMPLTLLSHMLDCQLFDQQSGMHHLVNVLFHMLATLLLFFWLRRASGARWPSAFVALIFAVHPLHVESVAWIAERKDVLSATFWFLGMYAYVRYVERPSSRGYLLLALIFALGLLAKPMTVTFPFALLLLDVWPLRRFRFPAVLWEKVPLIALSAAMSYVTYFVQGSTAIFQAFALPVRLENSLISYVVYIGQMFWPAGLAALYPYQASPSLWQAAASAIILLLVTAAVILAWRTRPYLAVGWFWYLGTLVPVIGLVQVGVQERADRYMYIPMVGLLIMVAWGARDVIARWPAVKLWILLPATVAGAACIPLAWVQAGYWQDSGTLFERVLDVTKDNYVAEYNFGNYLMNTRRRMEAIPYFEAALRLHPNYPEAESNLGSIIGGIPGRMPEAISHFEAAIRLNPDLLPPHYNLALALEQIPGRKAEALEQYRFIERKQPTPQVEKAIERLTAKN